MLIKLKPGIFEKIPFPGYIYAALTLDILTVFAIFILKSWLPPIVPLFYGRPGGPGQLVTTYELLIAPAVSILVTVLNFWLITHITDIFLKKVLVASIFLLSLLTSIAVFKIIFLVGFF